MFSALFVVCNMELGLCRPYAAEYVFTNNVICIDYAEEMRQQALSQLPSSAIIMYQCVEFPRPT